MKKKIISIVVIIAAVVGLFIVLNKNKAKSAEQTAIVAQKNNAVSVRTSHAEVKELNMHYTANGTFIPQKEVTISTEIPGRISRVLVEEGDKVKAGQTLAIIEGNKQNVNVANAQAVYNDALNEVDRFKSAYETGGVTKQQLDQVKLQLENAKSNLKSAQLNINDLQIKASFPGIINKRNIEPGSYVNPGQELFEVVNIQTLKLRVTVDEKTVGALQLGEEAEVNSSAFPTQDWTGTVSFIAPKADGSLNFPVELEIKNNGSNTLKAGMYGTVVFGKNNTLEALVIPRTAFLGNVSSNKVFVVSNDTAQLKQVVSGKKFGEDIEILSGLSEGDQVITSGQINLLDGTPIEILK